MERLLSSARPRGGADDLICFGPVISAIGSGGFSEAMQGAIRQRFGIDHVTAMLFTPDGPQPLFYASSQGAGLMQTLTKSYVGEHYREDPNFPILSAWDPSGGRLVIRRAAEDFPRPYRDLFFRNTGIIEKLSIISPVEGRPLAVNLYATREHGRYSEAEIEQIVHVSPIVTHAILRHSQLHHGAHPASPRGMENAARLLDTVRSVRFSRRELEVCARILEGMSTTAIGLDLGIAPSSVATFRKNLYRKLGISSQAELFSLALGASQSEAPGPRAAE